MKLSILLLFCFVFVSSTAFADVVVDENFNDGTLGTLVSGSGGTIELSDGAVEFVTSVAVLTSQTDFTSSDFTATITADIPSQGINNTLFGVGTGDLGDYGEFSGPTAFVLLDSFGIEIGDVNSTSSGPASSLEGIPGVSGSTTLELDFDSTSGTLNFSIIGGEVSGLLGSVNLNDNGFDETNARIFFGGNARTSFDNFSVHVPAVAVPEPGTATLLGMGLLGSMIIRRRRS